MFASFSAISRGVFHVQWERNSGIYPEEAVRKRDRGGGGMEYEIPGSGDTAVVESNKLEAAVCHSPTPYFSSPTSFMTSSFVSSESIFKLSS